MPFGLARIFSRSASFGQDHENGLKQDLDIQPDRPLVDVLRIERDDLAEVVGDNPAGEDPGAENGLRDALERWLREQSPEQRRIFLLRYWYAYPVAEAAEKCGVSVGAAKMSLGRSKKRLRKFLEKEGFQV